MDEITDYGLGWAFAKSAGRSELPGAGVDLVEWIKGYAGALADMDPQGECPSVETSLKLDGVAGEILAKLLDAGEAVERGEGCKGGKFERWPGIPVRHSVEAEHERDYRLARNAGLLSDDEAAALEVSGAWTA